MTAGDLESIEQALGFPLPGFYKRFMQEYPRSLPEKQPGWLKPVTEWEFADNPERVIQFNRFVRDQEEGYFVDDGTWPDEYFVIGNEEDQNYFAVNRLGGAETVYFWSHEDGEFHPIAGALEAYAEWLVEWWDDIRRRNQE
jgi:SMI1-KNR4 cell-wall